MKRSVAHQASHTPDRLPWLGLGINVLETNRQQHPVRIRLLSSFYLHLLISSPPHYITYWNVGKTACKQPDRLVVCLSRCCCLRRVVLLHHDGEREQQARHCVLCMICMMPVMTKLVSRLCRSGKYTFLNYDYTIAPAMHLKRRTENSTDGSTHLLFPFLFSIASSYFYRVVCCLQAGVSPHREKRSFTVQGVATRLE